MDDLEGMVIGKFKPCTAQYNDAGYTEMLLKDCFTVWTHWGNPKYHTVDLGYDKDNNLVGIRIWDLVEKYKEV